MKILDFCQHHAKAMSETANLAGGGRLDSAVMPGAGAGPFRLGRYQVERELGKGAMGIVYLGTDTMSGRVVAIKTTLLSQKFVPEELNEAKKRFFREAQAAGRLNHPGIVAIYDAGEENGIGYIALEYAKGGDLAPYVKPDSLLPLDKLLSIIARVAQALAYAHKNNVAHRDIKPANIVYEPKGDAVKVTDFGIARFTNTSSTRTGIVRGTPSYMSPEQLAGKKIDGRSDLFSLGVALYQLACGHLPFEGDSMAQLMFKIANETHADIRTHNSKLPARLAAIVNKVLAKDPAQRYQDGEQMAKALRLCLQGSSAARLAVVSVHSTAPAMSV